MTRRSYAWTKLIRPAAMLLFTMLLFIHVSYSWIRREWTPSIAQDGIKITTSGSLVFQMGNNSNFSDSQTINEILNVSEFVLKPVSNSTGESGDFFTLNFNDSIGFEKFEHLNLSSYKDYTDMGLKNGYLEFTFVLHSPDGPTTTRYIYLDEAYIRDAVADAASAASCVRVSITNHSTGKTYIFAETAVKCYGITDETDENDPTKYLADNALLYESFSPTSDADSKYAEEIFYKDGDQRVPTGKLLMEEQIITPFASVCGKDANQNFDKNKVLFSMASGNGAPGVTLTIRIWLEGSDERCQASISAQQIDLKLKFAAFTEEELQNAQS